MNIQGVNIYNGALQRSTTGGVKPPSFECRKGSIERLRPYGKVIQETGTINGKKLDIYSAYNKEGELEHKLYYLADDVGRWIKSKLKYYRGGRCVKTIWSYRNDSRL